MFNGNEHYFPKRLEKNYAKFPKAVLLTLENKGGGGSRYTFNDGQKNCKLYA
jgi:hypothetical protein